MKKHNKGASIVLALYFLLIATVLSLLIILAGSVATGSISGKAALYKSENIALSCFKKISEEISGKTFKYSPDEGISFFEQKIKSDGVVLFGGFVSQAFENVTSKETYEKDFEIKLENMATKVSGTFSMNESYEIIVTIDKVVENGGDELTTKERSIVFYPLSVRNEGKTIVVNMGEGDFA